MLFCMCVRVYQFIVIAQEVHWVGIANLCASLINSSEKNSKLTLPGRLCNWKKHGTEDYFGQAIYPTLVNGE